MHSQPSPAQPTAPEFIGSADSSLGIQCPGPTAPQEMHNRTHISHGKNKGYYLVFMAFFFSFSSPVSLNEHKYIDIYILFLGLILPPRIK